MTDSISPDLETDVDLVRSILRGYVTCRGTTAFEIQSRIADMLGHRMAEHRLARAVAHLIHVTDEVRWDGDRYYWYETDTGAGDPYGPGRTPRPQQPKPDPWRYFVSAATRTGFANSEVTSAEEITSIEQIHGFERSLADAGVIDPVIVGYQLLSRPAPTPVVVRWEDGALFTVHHGDTEIGRYHFDAVGTVGQRAVIATVERLAAALGAPVVVEGTPGI